MLTQKRVPRCSSREYSRCVGLTKIESATSSYSVCRTLRVQRAVYGWGTSKRGVHPAWLPQGIAAHSCFRSAINKENLSDHHAIRRAGKPEQQFSYLFGLSIATNWHWHRMFQSRSHRLVIHHRLRHRSHDHPWSNPVHQDTCPHPVGSNRLPAHPAGKSRFRRGIVYLWPLAFSYL